MTGFYKQLNPFEVKTLILNIISKFKGISDLSVLKNLNVDLLDAQNDKKTIVKILYKELNNATQQNEYILRLLLERYAPKEELSAHLWSLLKNPLVSNETKIVAVNLLRDIDSGYSYDEFGKYIDNEEELIDHDTKLLLKNAIFNPEVQIDFLDFLSSLNTKDKTTLINSLGEDYTEDELANILIPVFLSAPDSEEGKLSLELLGECKSQLAYHALNEALRYSKEELKPIIKKNLSKLKLAGIREDNTHLFYKKLLSDSKPYTCCLTYPDGQGNQALIFTREKEDGRIQFASVVLDDYRGIKDCFGFNDISKFECEKIIERFYQDEEVLNITPEALKAILLNSEKLSDKFPYEYICWKNLLADIEPECIDIHCILEKQLTPQKLSKDDLKILLTDEFSKHWFLNYGYSDEYDELINCLNKKLIKADYKIDFDQIIDEHYETIFDKSEFYIWSERLLMSGYLKFLTARREFAEKIYGLYFDEVLKKEFFKNIIRKSIYEYYFGLKYNTELNDGKFSLNELDYIIKIIEAKWVQNV